MLIVVVGRAHCMMLNKGECIVEVVSTSDSIQGSSSRKKNVNDELKPLVLSNNLNS